MQQITHISTDVLRVHPRNQEFFDDIEGRAYEQFKESIKNDGVVTPLIVAPDMTIVSGHQRLKACEDLGIKKIPVIIREDLDDEDEKLKKLLATNFGRTKNDPAKQVKVAAEYVELVGLKNGEKKVGDYKKGKLTQNEIAQSLGVSERTLRELLEIDRKLIPQIRELFDSGNINKNIANKVLCRLAKEEQEHLYNILGESMTNFTTDGLKKFVEENLRGNNNRKAIQKITLKNLYIRSGGKCEICGWGDEYLGTILQAHHITEYCKTQDNSLDNLMMLCPNCHQSVHTIKNCEDVTMKENIASSFKSYINKDKYEIINKLIK